MDKYDVGKEHNTTMLKQEGQWKEWKDDASRREDKTHEGKAGFNRKSRTIILCVCEYFFEQGTILCQ